MRYDYECRECLYSEEVVQSIKDKPLTICPKCNSETFRRVINSPPNIAVKSYDTIGKLADKNWSDMGTYERDSKMEKDGIKEKIAAKENKQRINKIAKLSEQGKKKYIETGEL